MNSSRKTALRNTCILRTPSEVLNRAFEYAKDNIARCMRYYSLGWGMSNAPHAYTTVVGRDTGWMTVGADYCAPWFTAEALRVFKDRQRVDGAILEYVDLESGAWDDYGLNVADNTPLYIWAVCHHWNQFENAAFRAEFAPSVARAARQLQGEIGTYGLIWAHPKGTGPLGICSWRNIIEGYVLGGAVTEINSLSAMALRMAGEFLDEPELRAAGDSLAAAINDRLWSGSAYYLTLTEGGPISQVTGDTVFPVWCGVARAGHARQVLQRLKAPDFWNAGGLRTVPDTDPAWAPAKDFGLRGGGWPNLTLWYAEAVAKHDPDAALRALEMVAAPVVSGRSSANINQGEFPEWFDGRTGYNGGMPLSPWVAPTFIWALLEGLLGLQWQGGQAHFQPHWPAGWDEVTLEQVPCAAGNADFVLQRETNRM